MTFDRPIMRNWILGIAVLCTNVAACSYAIQGPTNEERVAVVDKWDAWPDQYMIKGEKQAYTGEDGLFMHPDYISADRFCKNIQVSGNAQWKQVGVGGWIVSGLGAAATGAFTGLAVKADDKPQTAAFGSGAALGAFATALGIYMITTAANGRRASADAATILLDDGLLDSTKSIAEKNAREAEKWRKCMISLKAWGDTNAAAADTAAAAIKELAKKAATPDDAGTAGDAAPDVTSDAASDTGKAGD